MPLELEFSILPSARVVREEPFSNLLSPHPTPDTQVPGGLS